MRAWAIEVDRDEAVRSVATEHPFWVPAHASLAETAAAMVNFDVRHLVVIDAHDRPLGVVSMADLFGVLMQSDEPSTMYASFAALLVRAAST
jgi:predicted transcriptional regulator